MNFHVALHRGLSAPEDVEVLWYHYLDDRLLFFNKDTQQWEDLFFTKQAIAQIIGSINDRIAAIESSTQSTTKQQAITGQHTVQIAHTSNQTTIILQVIGASGRSIDPSDYYTQRQSDYTEVVFAFPTTANIYYQLL